MQRGRERDRDSGRLRKGNILKLIIKKEAIFDARNQMKKIQN